jgi:hypothetical protein
VEFAQWLIKQSSLQPINQMPLGNRGQATADWLGVVSWSDRTKVALSQSLSDPASLALVALCSPEYIVSA